MTTTYSTETPQGYPPVGVKVKTPTFGTGVVVNYEVFSDSWAEPRIGVRLDNPKLWVFSSLNPEALPYFWARELEVQNSEV